MKKNISEDKILIGISAMKQIMSVFLGPFLTAYFIKRSTESIIDISIYYIFCYIILALLSFIVAKIIKRKLRIGMFRIGVIINFIYIMSIIILNESITKYLWLVAILSGISSSTYWMPFNLFSANKIKEENRAEYTAKSKIVASIIGILCPIFLGAYITITNYELTAMIILFVSIIQIVLSFYLKKDEDMNLPEYNLKKAAKVIVRDKRARKLMLIEFLTGTNICDGALGVLITILIFNSFKTNMNLGIITSITTILSMISVKIYVKFYKNRDKKGIIILSSIMPAIAVLISLIFKNNITLIMYNAFYSIFTTIISLVKEINLFNISNSISKDYKYEFFAIREGILNYGRLISYTLLFIVGVINSAIALNLITVILTLMIIPVGFALLKVEK